MRVEDFSMAGRPLRRALMNNPNLSTEKIQLPSLPAYALVSIDGNTRRGGFDLGTTATVHVFWTADYAGNDDPRIPVTERVMENKLGFSWMNSLSGGSGYHEKEYTGLGSVEEAKERAAKVIKRIAENEEMQQAYNTRSNPSGARPGRTPHYGPKPQMRTRYRNPLAGWDRQYSGTVGSGDYYYGPMLKADAEEKFRASMATSDRILNKKGFDPLPLSFFIRQGVPLNTAEDAAMIKAASNLAADTQSVALIEYIYSRMGDKAPKPGDPNRETPHTLFNSLHRLCEFISGPPELPGRNLVNPISLRKGDIVFLPCMPPVIYENYQTAIELVEAGAEYIRAQLHPNDRSRRSSNTALYRRALFSSGLNTASGRLGAIDDADQALAEGFAKFCLSMDDVYDPKAPLLLNGQPVVLEGHAMEIVVFVRKTWAMVLGSTIESLLRVFNWFVESYYNGRLPQIKDMRMFPFQHWDSEYSYENSQLKSLSMTGRDGETLQFITPKIDTELRHAVDLYRATSSLFSVSSEEMSAAQFTVYEALDSLLTLDQRQALRKTAPRSAFPEHQFLRQKYAKPLRNTPASIAKAKRVLAAIEVIESASRYRRRPGLHVSFIQPQESE